jgi:hypothetical protein
VEATAVVVDGSRRRDETVEKVRAQVANQGVSKQEEVGKMKQMEGGKIKLSGRPKEEGTLGNVEKRVSSQGREVEGEERVKWKE